MYKYSERFQKFVNDCKNGLYKKPTDVPPDIFALEDWNFLPRKEAEDLFLPFIRYQIDRALRTMPGVYLKPYREVGISPESINSIEDFWRIPPLPKDNTVQNPGLRIKTDQSGYGVVRPNDLEDKLVSAGAYLSGGTMGGSGQGVPTWLTEWDFEVETQASYRGLLATGIKTNSVVVNIYNISHKGGYVITKALNKLNKANYIQVKTTDTAKEVTKFIELSSRDGYELLLVGAQPPIVEGDPQKKGSGRMLFDIRNENPKVFRDNVDRILLGGFRIIPEVEALSKGSGKPITTIYGSTELMPVFFGTPYDSKNPNKICTFNNLHEMLGPHYSEVIKYDEKTKTWIPAKPGENTVLALTSVFRQGTIYLRYIIGDAASVLREEQECECGKSTSRVINEIKRIGKETEDITLTGCAAL